MKNVLILLASPATHPTLGYPVGFWASELTHAWYELREAGHAVVLASPEGGAVTLDAYSDPSHESGYSADDVLSRGFLADPKLTALLETTAKLSEIDLAGFDALYVAGGQSPVFTFREDRAVANAIRSFYESERITAVVCHGTAALLDLKLSSGALLIEGKTMTGFSSREEDLVDQAMGAKVMPYRIEDEARARGASFLAAAPFTPFALRDGQLITGQQQHSGRAAATLLIEGIGRAR